MPLQRWWSRVRLGAMRRRYIMKHLYFQLLRAWLAAASLGLLLPVGAQPPGAGAAAARVLGSSEEWLALVNAQRAAGARCGEELLPPAPPLRWHPAMEAAAVDHLHDVARRGELSHEGSDGSTVGARLRRHGYTWGGVGENVAAGHRTAASTLQQWLGSPAHCRTLMQGNYRYLAVVGREVPGSRYGAWWVMVLARPL